jgi:hypothetical protein
VEAGQPKALFETGMSGGEFSFNIHFDVTKDGRFLIPVEVKEAGPQPISVVLNWTAMLKR